MTVEQLGEHVLGWFIQPVPGADGVTPVDNTIPTRLTRLETTTDHLVAVVEAEEAATEGREVRMQEAVDLLLDRIESVRDTPPPTKPA